MPDVPDRPADDPPDGDLPLDDLTVDDESVTLTELVTPTARRGRVGIHPVVEVFASYGWRLLVIGAVAAALFWLLAELWVLVLTLVIAVYLARVLDTPTRWLRDRGAPPAAAALIAVLGMLAALGLMVALLVPRISEEFSALGPTLTQATDDVERWLIEDSPFDLNREDVEDLRATMADAARDAFQSSEGSVISGAIVAVEVLTGLILSLVTTFFILKDGSAFQQWCLGRLPAHRRPLATRLGARAWGTLGGYLRGVGILGTLEGFVLGVTIALVGGELAWPVAILTFFAAFVPIVGAVVSGVVAVLVALATAGTGPAVIVAVTALVVQQLDNDLLAPLIYGRSLQLHPLVVLFSIVVGGALFGLGGTILSVPVTAVIVNVLAEARSPGNHHHEGDGHDGAAPTTVTA